MQEKKYFITAKTKGENPVVLFLNGNTAWTKYAMLSPLVGNLRDCHMRAEREPTHCLFVEAKDSLRKELNEIMHAEKDFVTPAELKQLIEKYDCHTVSTKQKKEKPAKEEQRQPTQDAAAEQPQKRVGYVLVRENLGGEKCYKLDTKVNVIVGDSLKLADVFMTKEQAHFTCYTLNRFWNTTSFYSVWKVEQIEF